MAYVKPGVEVKQVQTTVSPNLSAPSLSSAVVGQCYNLVDFTYDGSGTEYSYDSKYQGSELVVSMSGLMTAGGAKVDTGSVYVSLHNLEYGGYKHLTPSTHFTANSNGTVTISGSIDSAFSASNKGTVYIGYRELRTDVSKTLNLDSVSAIVNALGKVDLMNPLAYGAKQALQNAGASIWTYGVTTDDVDASTGHAAAAEALESKDIYSIAPLSSNSVDETWESHCNNLSTPSNKRERIVFNNKVVGWKKTNGDAATTVGEIDKTVTATVLRDAADANNSKRNIWIMPDTCYVVQSMPIACVKKSKIDSMFPNTGLASTYGGAAYCKWNGNQVVNGVQYYDGIDIDDATWTALMLTRDATEVNVLVPVPGYYISACVAGMVSGLPVQQGFTNYAIGGDIKELYGSNFTFTEAQLDKIASGGNYIMSQSNVVAPIVSRHQLTTDNTTVEKQELSIVKSLDYVSKFVRDGVSPYIGTYNITPSFIKLIKTVLNAHGSFLRTEGIVADLKVLKVEQNVNQKDQILVDLNVLVQYPVNYIKMTLQF
tara:strand:+ start:1766 stop:3391 length:1626 start_codon:yes stop_codon:yes gene_type:complete